MVNVLYALFIALTNNIDNIGVRIAYSLKGIKIDVYKNILIAVITFIISTIAAYFGTTLLNIITPTICNILTMIIFIILGLSFILEPYKKKKDTTTFIGIITSPSNADIDNSKTIDLKEAIFLGIALNLNNIGGSISAGILGINIYLIGILSTIISFLALALGNYLNYFFRNIKVQKKTTFITGLILIIFGIKQLL